jgi:hypothetical protein
VNHRVLWVSSLLVLATACGGRSTGVLEDDESSDDELGGAAGTGGSTSASGSGGSGGGQGIGGSTSAQGFGGSATATGGWGGSQGIAGSGGSQGIAGSGGSQGIAGADGTAGTTASGEGQPCTSQNDCAGFDATFCDVFVTGSCLVRDCTVTPDSCSAGKECCDLTNFGLPTLCIAEGACAD